MKRNFLLILSLLISSNAFSHDHEGEEINYKSFQPKASEKTVYLTVDRDAISRSKSLFKENIQVLETGSDIAVIEVKESGVEYLSHMMHEEFRRCGGFMHFDNVEDAMNEASDEGTKAFAKEAIFADYSINSGDLVRPMIADVAATNIEGMIRKLSSFRNRYYQSDFGLQSQEYIKSTWESILANRKDAKVEFWQHASWKQPSVIATIKGVESPDEIIVVGGHADSISGWFGGNNVNAPGADDNASGMSTVTEIMRVLVANNYQPKKTIMFMGYAAEEVGLRGSKEIAQRFKSQNKNVLGVMQLDMTNYKGSSDKDIVMMTDFTNRDQNEFIGKLIDAYLPNLAWGYDRCGYGCSDHASWHSAGFAASMPFEAKKNDMNSKIHTSSDTIERSRGNANHASKFAKMGLAFVVELDQ